MTNSVTKRGVVAVAALALLLASLGIAASMSDGPHEAHAATSTNDARTRTTTAISFRNAMRELWEDHIVWTRMFIVSAVAGSDDTDVAAGRLLANQDHIGDAIKPYYGEAAGNQLTTLLRDHILIAADLVSAAKTGDPSAVEDASARWSDNADDIADLLASANPRNWNQAEMRSMMADHLELTLSEATARLSQDWEADVEAYDAIHGQILHMADMLSLGIIRQFPRKF